MTLLEIARWAVDAGLVSSVTLYVTPKDGSGGATFHAGGRRSAADLADRLSAEGATFPKGRVATTRDAESARSRCYILAAEYQGEPVAVAWHEDGPGASGPVPTAPPVEV